MKLKCYAVLLHGLPSLVRDLDRRMSKLSWAWDALPFLVLPISALANSLHGLQHFLAWVGGASISAWVLIVVQRRIVRPRLERSAAALGRLDEHGSTLQHINKRVLMAATLASRLGDTNEGREAYVEAKALQALYFEIGFREHRNPEAEHV